MSTSTPTATYTIDEAAELIGISRRSAYNAAHNGDIPAKRIGGRWVVLKTHLWQYLGLMDTSGRWTAPPGELAAMGIYNEEASGGQAHQGEGSQRDHFRAVSRVI